MFFGGKTIVLTRGFLDGLAQTPCPSWVFHSESSALVQWWHQCLYRNGPSHGLPVVTRYMVRVLYNSRGHFHICCPVCVTDCTANLHECGPNQWGTVYTLGSPSCLAPPFPFQAPGAGLRTTQRHASLCTTSRSRSVWNKAKEMTVVQTV